MLEKIFGKKSTGVVYIVCASVLLLSLAASALLFLVRYPDASLYVLFTQALVTVISLAAISAPVFIQKRFRYYIPPFIEIALCAYVLLFLLLQRAPENGMVLYSFLPASGGFMLSMVLFAVFYSVLSKRAQAKGRRTPLFRSVAGTFGAALALMAALGALAALSSVIMNAPRPPLHASLLSLAHYLLGSLLFCATGYFAARSHEERFRIRSFKNTESAERFALEKKNRSMYTVVGNLSRDTTDYRGVFLRAKASYYTVRIAYLALYAGYIVFSCITFWELSGWGQAIAFFLCSSFLFTTAVYIYEYFLFRKRTVNQRLRKLKIAKTTARSYSLLLILAAMYFADFHYSSLSVVLSVGMLLFNLCLLFYNLFGKPRRYPPVKKKNKEEGACAEKESGKE